MSKKKPLLILVFITILLNISAQHYEVMFIQQQYDEIIEKSQHSKNATDYYWAAQAYKAKGENTKALSSLESYQDSSATSNIQALKAELYYSLGRYTEAEQYYQLTSASDASFYKLMQVYENKGNYIRCINDITMRIDSTSTNIALLSILANSYYRSQAKVMAQNTYQRLYDIDPNNTAVAYKLCVMLINTMLEGEIRNASKIAENVLVNDPENIRFVRVNARALFLLEKYKGAMAAYETLYKNGYRDEVTCQRLGICEYKGGFYREAVEHFSESLLQNANSLHTNMYLGKCYHHLSNSDKSLYFLAQADSLLQPKEEHLATLCWERHWCYLQQKEYEKVDSCLQQMLQYDDDALNYYHIANNYDKNLRNKEMAIKYYQLYIDKTDKKEQNGFVMTSNYRIKKLKEDKFWGQD